MTFSQAIADKFFGQQYVLSQLDVLGGAIVDGENFNIALCAPSGKGKTTLAKLFVEWCANGEPYLLHNAEEVEFDRKVRFHVLDEAHRIKNPEFLYPYMDSKKYTFLLLTNEYYALKEPFYNRCHNLSYDSYTREDLVMMCKSVFAERGRMIMGDMPGWIVDNFGRGVPRTVKVVSDLLALYWQKNPTDKEQAKKMAEELLQTSEGLTKKDREYLQFLWGSGRSSITLIANSTRIPREVILKEIEPYLINKGYIKITSKGRELTALGDKVMTERSE